MGRVNERVEQRSPRTYFLDPKFLYLYHLLTESILFMQIVIFFFTSADLADVIGVACVGLPARLSVRP